MVGRPRPLPPRRAAVPALCGLAAGVTAIVLQPVVLADDAAISLRYAARLADGAGLTYNDHERVLGASNPLFVLLVASGRLLGVDTEQAARAIAVAAFVAVVVVAVELGTLLSSRLGGALAGVLLTTMGGFRGQALSGMEVGLSAALGLGAILAAARRRPVAAGVLVGLALLTKADALTLALAVVVACVVGHRRVRPMLIAAAAVVLPWLAYSWVAYGSMVPHAVDAKLDMSGPPFDPLWMLKLLGWPAWLLAGLAVALTMRLWPERDPSRRLVLTALWGWFLLHFLAYSTIDLGAPYPWYGALLVPPLTIMGAAFVGRDVAEPAAIGPVPGRPALLLTVAMVALLALPGASDAARQLRPGGRPLPYERVLVDNRDAGVAVARLARPGEVVRSCYGWVGYAALGQPVDDPCLLNSVRSPGAPTWQVVEGVEMAGQLDRFRLVSSFATACRDEADRPWFALLVRRGSAADRRVSGLTGDERPCRR